MSDATTTQVAETTIAIDPSTQKASTPAPASAAKGEPEEKPSWLDARLERERRSLLKELGIDSVESARKDFDELKAAREAKKTDAQKAAETETSLKAATARLDEMQRALVGHAKDELSKLTEPQRNAVVAVAGDDPAKQLSTITALRSTWTSAAATPAAPVAQTPKDTAPLPSAPKEGGKESPPDSKAVYAELKKTNPVLAARYAFANGVFDQ